LSRQSGRRLVGLGTPIHHGTASVHGVEPVERKVALCTSPAVQNFSLTGEPLPPGTPNCPAADLTRARNRLTKFLLRHSLVYRDGSNWTYRFERWLSSLHFENQALAATFGHYRSTVQLRDASLEAVEADLAQYFGKAPFSDAVRRLGDYRGITHMGGFCLGAEVFDWRRFPGARAFMSFTGLTCSEDSTGPSPHRGEITRAGNAHVRGQLCEAAWSHQHRPGIGR